MNGVTQFLTRFGPGRLAAMGAVTLALVGFFAFVILRVSQPAMGVLFTELSPADLGAVTRDLDARGTRYDTRDDGGTVLVPRSDLARIRMELAGKGLPSGGGVGYEIFDKGDAFSTTSFVQNINHLRALEGELARTIRTLARVQNARVHLALPERRLFERDREPARASIMLKVRGELGPDGVGAIRHLVASAVEGLRPDQVSIVDERGRLLANGSAGTGEESAATGQDDKRAALERRLRGQVEELVAGIVGTGRARVQVAAELDPNRVESRQESFDPEGRVVRSTQTRGENAQTDKRDGQVSVANELPGAKDAAANAAGRDQSAKNEEVVNYEISRTTRTEVQQSGRVKRLSVAVLIDGSYARGPNGETGAYQPRSKEDLDRISALVRTAIGFDAARGDQVEVVNLPFAEAPAAAMGETASLLASLLSPTKDDILRWAELGLIAVLTLVVLTVVVRPMVRQIVAPAALLAAPALAVTGPDGQALPALAGGASSMPGAGQAGGASPAALQAPAEADPVARLGTLAKENPKQAAAVLRGWMANG